MTTDGSTPTAVLQAKFALRFQPNVKSSSNKIDVNNSTKEKVHCQTNDSNLPLNSTFTLKPVHLIREILDSQEILSKYKAKEEENQLKEEWSYPLGDPKVVSRLADISNRLTKIVDEKEVVLETLRHPIAENSIPWRRDRQVDLVNSFKFLKLLSENKDTNNSNTEWIENQDWNSFAGNDLPAIETKILKLEAEIASGLKECKTIKGFAD